MVEGLNYITMRDGVKLAATVHLPPGKSLADGPFPPSSRSPATPSPPRTASSTPSSGSTGRRCPTRCCPIRRRPWGADRAAARIRHGQPADAGHWVLGRGVDLFGLPTTYDGYDAVQIVAAQPWVANHKVGMVGISFSGISQMFVAGTRPPGLAAIAPMSLTDDLYSTGFPGGIYNGFAATWLEQRLQGAEPAPQGGEEYARSSSRTVTSQCLANQVLHGQTQNLNALLQQASHYVPSLYVQRSPSTWAKRVDVPVFVSGAFQDEQTGGQWPAILSDLSGDPHVWATIVNGTHVDSLGPGTIVRWLEFLDIFVADQVPKQQPLLSTLAPALYQALASAPVGSLPPLQYTAEPNVAAARAAFERQPRVRVFFDNGGGSAGPGAMQPVWSKDYSSWPPPGARATTLNLGSGGTLSARAPSSGQVSFQPNPAARPTIDLPTGNVWSALPPYQWAPVSGTDGLGFITPPLKHNLVVVGPASLNLWVKSTAPDTDLQATISEVRRNGEEMFMNTGALRASDRALNKQESTATHPVPTYAASTARPLPAGKFTEVRIPILPFASAFRAGSRIRVTITAPGGDRPVWAFATYQTNGRVSDTIGLGGDTPSALVLSVVSGLQPPDPQPACPSLRGQPCRTYVAAANGG